MNLVFEQPLNEKVRNYLRIESVANQLYAHSSFETPGSDLAFFRTLFELMELLDRSELRNELLKDLEKQLAAISHWRSVADVDQQQLNTLDSKLSHLCQALHTCNRPVQKLKVDPFLAALKQRMAIPGGFCGFDLPQFAFWQAMPREEKLAVRQLWLATLVPILDSVDMLLNMLRETGRWQNKVAVGGCIQETNEQDVELLQVEVKREYGVYPAISAHRNRYTIHLINFETGKGDNRNLPLRVALSLEAKCQ